jgi:Zn-dependent peptidase ImmA (M78 family)
MRWTERTRAASHALVEAQRFLRDEGSDPSQPVDVFRLILEREITLAFKPYKKLFGAYIPATGEAAPLITVNADHPLALQRYTAAHELGHHIERSEAVHDVDVEILARGIQPPSYSETFAEAFAAWLLMPRRLVVAKLQELGLPLRELDAEQLYRLSLELGTSYDATATQLRVLNHLSRTHYLAVRKVPPRLTKERLAGSPRRAAARADIWALGDPGTTRLIRPKPEDEVIVDLPEAPGTSYEWEPINLPGEMVTEFSSVFLPAHDSARTYDGAGLRRLRFQVAGPGRAELRFVLHSPFDPRPARTRTLLLDVAALCEGTYEDPAQLAA